MHTPSWQSACIILKVTKTKPHIVHKNTSSYHRIQQLFLVHFYVNIYVANKFQRRKERHCPEHQEENVAGQESVTKEFDSLQHSRHARSLKVVEQGIEENEQSR